MAPRNQEFQYHLEMGGTGVRTPEQKEVWWGRPGTEACAIKASGDDPPCLLLVSPSVPRPCSKGDFWRHSQPLVGSKVCAHTGRCHQTLCGVQVFVHMPAKDVQVPGRELSAGNSGVSHTHPCPYRGHSLAARNQSHRMQWPKPTSISPVSQVPRPAVR